MKMRAIFSTNKYVFAKNNFFTFCVYFTLYLCVYISERREEKVISDWNNYALNICCMYCVLLNRFKAMQISCHAQLQKIASRFYFAIL